MNGYNLECHALFFFFINFFHMHNKNRIYLQWRKWEKTKVIFKCECGKLTLYSIAVLPRSIKEEPTMTTFTFFIEFSSPFICAYLCHPCRFQFYINKHSFPIKQAPTVWNLAILLVLHIDMNDKSEFSSLLKTGPKNIQAIILTHEQTILLMSITIIFSSRI